MSTIELVDPELRDALALWPLPPLTAESLARRRAEPLRPRYNLTEQLRNQPRRLEISRLQQSCPSYKSQLQPQNTNMKEAWNEP